MEDGQENISSEKLADFVGVHSWQIRKDFSYFGDFGIRGKGYEISKLIKEIKAILKLKNVQKAALVGVGNLGSAIIAYPGFGLYGFDVAVAFDNDPKKVGKKVKKIEIFDISRINLLAKENIKFGIIAVPRNAAQDTADKLIESGVTGILNFSPSHIVSPAKVKLITIDIAVHLAQMPYYSTNK